MKPQLFWLPGPWRGHLAIAARPRGDDWLEDEALSWRRAGIDAVVSLLEPDEAEPLGLASEDREFSGAGIEFISFPIPDRGIPQSGARAIALLKDIVRRLEGGQAVAIHCRQGIGRSGLFASGALIVAGMEPDEAVEAVSSARGLPIPETDQQLRWIHDLSPTMAAKVI